MKWKSAVMAAVIVMAGWTALLWNGQNGLNWQPQTVQTIAQNTTEETIQQLSTLQTEIEKEAFAYASVDIQKFGGWPELHTTIGTLKIPDAQIECKVIYGDNASDLKKGGCFYPDLKDRIPGGGRQMLMASHNNTFFHTLGQVQEGSRVLMDLYYGQYEYEVVRTEVVKASDTTTYDLQKEEEELIIYTCYPFDQLSATPYRFFVYCKPVYARPLQK